MGQFKALGLMHAQVVVCLFAKIIIVAQRVQADLAEPAPAPAVIGVQVAPPSSEKHR